MKDSSQQQFAATIGIDWADRKHDICEIPTNSDTPLFSVIRLTPKSIHHWALELLQRYPNQQVAACCELKKGSLIQAEILTLHRKELTALKPDTASIRALAQLTECCRKLVQERVKLTNRSKKMHRYVAHKYISQLNNSINKII